MMDSRDSRELDGVIDDVARAMTGTDLARDLRPAVAARIASRGSWTMKPGVWRAAFATAALAAVALLALAWWPGEPPSQVARSMDPSSAVAVPEQVPVQPTTSGGALTEIRTSRRPVPAVSRQTIVAATEAAENVDIRPLAIVSVEADPLVPLEEVEIAPIDVKQVRIAEFGELVE